MRMVEANYAEVNKKHYKLGVCQQIINEFSDSGLKCVEILDYNNVDAYSCTSSLNQAAKRLGKVHILAFTKKGKVYLINDLVK